MHWDGRSARFIIPKVLKSRTICFAKMSKITLFLWKDLPRILRSQKVYEVFHVCPQGGRAEKFELKFFPRYFLLMFRKNQEVSFCYVHPFKSTTGSQKTWALSASPPKKWKGLKGLLSYQLVLEKSWSWQFWSCFEKSWSQQPLYCRSLSQHLGKLASPETANLDKFQYLRINTLLFQC